MSERTGATEEQRMAAYVALSNAWGDETIKQHKSDENVDCVLAAACPPGMVIVPESAVPDQAVIAAIRGLERRHAEWQQGSRDPEAEIVNAWLDAQEGR